MRWVFRSARNDVGIAILQIARRALIVAASAVDILQSSGEAYTVPRIPLGVTSVFRGMSIRVSIPESPAPHHTVTSRRLYSREVYRSARRRGLFCAWFIAYQPDPPGKPC